MFNFYLLDILDIYLFILGFFCLNLGKKLYETFHFSLIIKYVTFQFESMSETSNSFDFKSYYHFSKGYSPYPKHGTLWSSHVAQKTTMMSLYDISIYLFFISEHSEI